MSKTKKQRTLSPPDFDADMASMIMGATMDGLSSVGTFTFETLNGDRTIEITVKPINQPTTPGENG